MGCVSSIRKENQNANRSVNKSSIRYTRDPNENGDVWSQEDWDDFCRKNHIVSRDMENVSKNRSRISRLSEIEEWPEWRNEFTAQLYFDKVKKVHNFAPSPTLPLEVQEEILHLKDISDAELDAKLKSLVQTASAPAKMRGRGRLPMSNPAKRYLIWLLLDAEGTPRNSENSKTHDEAGKTEALLQQPKE